jgi:hypothetical protein
LVDISRAAYGFFVDEFTYTINYPWVASWLDFLWNLSEGDEVEPLLGHGTVDDLLGQLTSLGFQLSQSRVLRTLRRSRTDLLLIDCIAT